MSNPKHTAPPTSEKPVNELADAQLEQVAGGFNPQPEPPLTARLQDMLLRNRLKAIVSS